MNTAYEQARKICEEAVSKDPIEILETLMDMPGCPMHGPIHHYLVGAALLTAYRNASGELELPAALKELESRASCVPGAVCGLWGACGACISTGQYLSVVTGSGPLAEEPWGTCIGMTAKALEALAEIGGPRCCKRDSYLSVLAAIDYTAQKLGVQMKKTRPSCSRSQRNAQCIGKRCPFCGGEL